MSFYISAFKVFKKSVRSSLRYLCKIPLRRRYCCVCSSNIFMFIPGCIPAYVIGHGFSFMPPLMEALDVVGSDLAQFNCPKCGSHDRERHLLLYFNKTGVIDTFNDAHVLHFAPEINIVPAIRAKNPARYVRCDLYPRTPDEQKIDMLDIPYQDESFDIVIANHILEHVPDVIVALRELHRVLKKGGLAILQTPFSRKLINTLHDPGINDDFSRSQAYGQDDHVRLFGSDIFKKIEIIGFKSKVVCHDDVLPDVDAKIFGVNKKEPFFLFERI